MTKVLALQHVFCAFCLFVIFAFSLYAFIPAQAILDRVAGGAEGAGFHVECRSVHKVVPLALFCKDVRISDAAGEVIAFDDVRMSVAPLSLLIFSPRIEIRGASSSGRVDVAISGQGKAVTLQMRDYAVSRLPYFKRMGSGEILGSVTGGGDLTVVRDEVNGDLRFDGTGVAAKGLSLGNVPVPDGAFAICRAAVSIRKGAVNLSSLLLDGKDGVIRLKGPIGARAETALSMELMPKAETVTLQPIVFGFLSQYLDTPGHYTIPISLPF